MISRTHFHHLLAVLCIVLLAFPATSFAQESAETETAATAPEKKAADILGTLEAEGDFTVLLGAINKSGVSKVLMTEGPFTLFAPTDEAFGKLPEGTLEEYSNEELATLLKGHLVAEKVTSEHALSLGTASASSGEKIKIEKTDDGVMVNNAMVVKADIMARNGVIHSIDTVLGFATQDTIGKADAPETPVTKDQSPDQ